MQSGDSQQGIGGVTSHGRNPSVAPPGRSSSSSSSSASPSSSSSAVSAPHQGVASTHQHLEFRPSLQQQLTEPPEGDEARLAHQAHGLHGGAGGSNSQSSSGPMFLPERPGQFDFFQQLGSEESENNTPGVAQFSAQNPNHEAYMRYAAHAAQQKSLGIMRQQNLGKTGSLGSVPDEDKNAQINNFRSQEHISTEAPNLKHSSALRKPVEHFMHGERQTEQGLQLGSGQRSDSSPFRQVAGVGQIMAGSMMRPMQTPQAEPNVQNQNIVSNQLAVAQFQAMQTWAMENNIDLSLPANANLVPQLFQLWQPRMAAPHKSNESNVATQAPHQLLIKQHVMSSEPVPTDGSARGNSSSDVSGILGPEKSREAGPYGSFAPTSSSLMVNTNNIQMQQLDVESREGRACKQPMMNGVAPMHAAQSSANTSQGIDHCLKATTIATGAESSQAQYFRRLHQLNRSSPQSAVTSSEEDSTYIPSQDGQLTQVSQQRLGFTKKQFHVLKAQILAFRRVNRGDLSLPQEVLRAIVPPPLESQLEEVLDPGTINQERSTNNNVEEHQRHSQSNEVPPRELHMNRGTQSHPGEESFAAEERAAASSGQMQVVAGVMKDHMWKVPVWKEEGNNATFSLNSGQEIDRVGQKIHVKGDLTAERGKAIATEIAVSDAMPVEASTRAGTLSQPKDVGVPRKYSGPLFDSPLFDSKKDSVSSLVTGNNANKLTLAYDVKDILLEEGKELLSKKRSENLKKINGLLAVNLEKKRISPDLVLRLQIEEKKLRLVNLQARMRDEIDQQQQVIMAMPDRPYRKFVKLCERQRMEFARQVQVSQKISRDKQLRSIFLWRKKFLDAHWAIRDARASQNKGVAKYHERMLREFSKRKDEDRNKRMEALKNNDVDRYREMLLEQQTTITGDAAQRYSVLSSFLSQTEEYLHKLGGKITATKNQQEVEDAAAAAAAAARSRGLSDEEVKAAATCAGQEVMTRSRFSEMNAQKDTASVNKYYNLAHAVNEKVSRQPSMLRAGTLRDYQLIGLQWMLSLYNNKLNGILADEMGLGKTVQVMALIAYLMEFKGNYGPHLIIVPNAVLVNWKSELHNWLPSVSCIYYVGTKDQRSRLFSQEVRAMKFNILVTTYEFIMFDRSKLSKIDWKYIVIDEAQRMKDRESVLARDLDRYRCQRRLLLTGTPLQNDLKELWSLLNLLLPEVFDNRKVFHDWFSKPFQKDAPVHESEDDWLETEKKVIIIHRLHQILEPFMLRRRVEDVEGSLPRKVSIVLRCKMSAIQGAIYDWIKSTGTIRVDPEDELMRVQKNPLYQAKTYKTLNNKCMELRKTCNHPLLNYPYFNDYSKDFLVRSCGKLWILDRILIKLHRTGHRVLLFSTMTKLLDILEEYLQWRGLIYRRIDGTTSLEDRESAIVDFNKPDTDCFIFLLSIRAAGRGLNLQSADTVVIYDPDPNPKNEEQAVARAHRIGQKREVKVIYMEAVVDRISSNQKEDEFRSGGSIDSEDDLAGKDRYIGSIESLIRSNIQQYKIDMADEVINAGRFDQRTTHEERRMTLEALLHDEERCQETVHKVPSLQEVNRMIARNEEEVKLFDQMDETLNWAEDMTRYDQVPEWLRTSTREVNAVSLNKKPSKKILTRNAFVEPGDMDKDDCPVKTERKRGRPKGSSSKRSPIYKELEEENDEFSGASRQERNGYSLHDEEGETSEEDGNGAVDATPVPKDQSGEEAPACDGGYEYPRALQDTKSNNLFKKSASSASSSGTLRLAQMGSPSTSAQKFRSLSALDSRSGSLPKGLSDELEDGEIVASGDSQAGLQLSGSLIRDRDYGGGEQSLRPKIKRKRSLRRRPRQIWEKNEDRPNNEKSSHSRGSTSQPGFHSDHDNETQLKNDLKHESFGTPFNRQARSDSATKNRRNILSRKGPDSSKSHSLPKSNRLTSIQVSTENTLDHSREPWDGRAMNSRGTITVANKMSDLVQRKCKNVITKLQRRIYMDGPQTVPLLTDFWKRNESSGCMSGTGGDTLLDLHMIDQCVDRFGYNRVMDFVSDMQSLLKNVTRYFCFSLEVRSEAKKVEDLYFDLMKIEFPETDLRDVEKTVSSSAAMVPFAPSSKQGLVGQVKRKREASPPPKLLQRRLLSADEGVRTRNPVSKFQKESRIGSSSRSPDQSTLGEPQLPSHPGELVICKKRRNEREKSVLKQTTTREPSSSVGRTVRGPGRASPPNAGRGSRGPVPASPPSVGRGVRGPGPNPSQREVKLSQPTAYHQHGWGHQPTQLAEGSGSGSGSEDSGWAKPVKRMRTDTAKKRQSYSHI